MKKKGQIKFGETFGVIIIVYLVFVVGMVWYNNVNTKDIKKMQTENQLNRAFEKYYYVVNNNLLHLSQQGDVDEEFDLVSMMVFNSFSSQEPGREMVRRQLGESMIVLEVLDKDFNTVDEFTLYNQTPVEFDSKEVFKTLIPVVDSMNQTTYVGVLSVYVYD